MSQSPPPDPVIIGYEDTVYLPFDFSPTHPDIRHSLITLARRTFISIEYDHDAHTLKITADMEKGIRDARDALNTLFRRCGARRLRTSHKMPKAVHPGFWGQPRAQLVSRAMGYTISGQGPPLPKNKEKGKEVEK